MWGMCGETQGRGKRRDRKELTSERERKRRRGGERAREREKENGQCLRKSTLNFRSWTSDEEWRMCLMMCPRITGAVMCASGDICSDGERVNGRGDASDQWSRSAISMRAYSLLVILADERTLQWRRTTPQDIPLSNGALCVHV